MQSPEERATIASMGALLGPEILSAVQNLYRLPHEATAALEPAVANASYGKDPRQVLDVYAPSAQTSAAPVLLWVHGGGFLRGSKGGDGDPYNAHVGRWAARCGMVGAVMNYRLAPMHQWPAGSEDVGLALDWLTNNVSAYGGDPKRIFLIGTSAGAAHIAGHLRLRPETPAKGAVLLSGLYGFTPLDKRDTQYFGSADLFPERSARNAVVVTPIPLLVAGAEFDPSRFQAELTGLLAARLERHGRLPRLHSATGHNHFSIAYHLGTADTRLSDEILSFIGDPR